MIAMRLGPVFAMAALVACGKKTPPAPETVATTAPPPRVTSAPVASAATSTTSVVEASAPAVEEESDAQVPWITARSHGCLGWNPATKNAICITGRSETGKGATFTANDVLDRTTSSLPWLSRDVKDDGVPDPEQVAAVAKLAAKLQLTPIDEKTAHKIAVGQEVTLPSTKHLAIKYERANAGRETRDTIWIICKSGKKQLFGAVTDGLLEATLAYYVDPTSKVAVVVWDARGSISDVMSNVTVTREASALGIDFTSEDECPI